jgi:hypothetical protein
LGGLLAEQVKYHAEKGENDLDIFRLIHSSVRDFLVTLPQYSQLRGHSRIADTCLKYLADSKFFVRRRGTLDKIDKPINDYSAEYWQFHLTRDCGLSDPTRLKVALLDTRFLVLQERFSLSIKDSVTYSKYPWWQPPPPGATDLNPVCEANPDALFFVVKAPEPQ